MVSFYASDQYRCHPANAYFFADYFKIFMGLPTTGGPAPQQDTQKA